ncbi:MAG: corrinoid protein [Andreesenia angusta]|nr:corrinoid protein [Andreesenia angusta]
MSDKDDFLKKMSDYVLEMEDEEIVELCKEFLEQGYNAFEGIQLGLADGMNRAGRLFEEQEYYIPELLLCSDAMYAGLEILKPVVIEELKAKNKDLGYKAVIGVVQGDTHDIGKNLFKIMLETVGFEVYDLGSNIPPQEFIDKIREVDADLLGLSTLMTTTMINMEKTVKMVKSSDLKDKVIVMVGGGPISEEYSNKVGADGFEPDVYKAVYTAKKLVSEMKEREKTQNKQSS